MIHSYKISGMTCTGCLNKVQKTLASLPFVKSAFVTLDPSQATIEMERHISTSELADALKQAGNYQIEELVAEPTASAFASSIEESIEEFSLKTYYPLILVFLFIIGGVILRGFYTGSWEWMDLMNNFMGGFFVVFSFFKLLNPEGFAMSYMSYDIIAKRWMGYGYIYPFIELALGIGYLMRFDPLVLNSATVLVMGISSIGVIQALLRKNKIKCACLGAVFNLPMSTITLLEDLLMVVMAMVMLIVH